MKFIADFHVHSKFSRATAKNLDLENLYIAAQIKGLTVVGTGDFTYPGWFSEIGEKLQPAEPGLFKLKDEYAAGLRFDLYYQQKSAIFIKKMIKPVKIIT
jgi:DNA helicase-2/ATP-dependent DNA helicase PcrA